MRKRKALVFAVVVAMAVLIALMWRKETPPQIITLPNGEQYQFVAAEWGTNQVQPTAVARFVSHLPVPVASYVYRKWGSRLGIPTPIAFSWGPGPVPPPKPALHFWFRSVSTNTLVMTNNFKFMLADQKGMVAGHGNGFWRSYGQGTDRWLTFGFPVLPRRSKMLQLLVFKAEDKFRGPYTQIGTVRVQNPLDGQFPNWQPETLPTTKTNGDLVVRLTDFRIAARNKDGAISTINGTQTEFHPPANGENQEIVFKLDIRSARGANEVWAIRQPELSDATGNRVQNEICGRSWETDEYYLGPALWPDESAWRLRLTLRSLPGHHEPEETFAFPNVSVPVAGATNITFQTNLIHSVPVVLKQTFVRKPDQTRNASLALESMTHLIAEVVNQPEGYVVDFILLKADTGWTPRESASRQPTDSGNLFLYSIPADVRTLDISWAVQKTRTVEFFVKPPPVK